MKNTYLPSVPMKDTYFPSPVLADRRCHFHKQKKIPAASAAKPPPVAAVVARGRVTATRASIRVADAVRGGREEAQSSYRRSKLSHHHSSLDPRRHRCSGCMCAFDTHIFAIISCMCAFDTHIYPILKMFAQS
jgi:hypothetical protein